MLKYCGVFVTSCFVILVGECLTLSSRPRMETELVITTKSDSMLDIAHLFDFGNNCSVDPVLPTLRHKLKDQLLLGAKLIQIELQFVNHTGMLRGQLESSSYKPLSWSRSTGRQGRSMLLLKSAFETLSLSTLGYGVQEMTVVLAENPPKCLVSMDVYKIEHLIRELLLNDFERPSTDGNTGGSLGENEHVCNMHVRHSDGVADFYYVCCQKDEHGKTLCEELIQDIWMTILNLCIFSFNFIFIMFGPLLIPETMYKEKYKDFRYELTLKTPIEVKIMKKAIHKKSPKSKNIISLQKFSKHETPKFRKVLDEMKCGTRYSLKISKLQFKVKADRLIPRNNVPVGVVRSLFDSLVRCKIREKHSLKECCNGDIFGSTSPCDRQYPWYKCLQTLMICMLLVVMACPWFIRVAVYYSDEHVEHLSRSEKAEANGLKVPFPGNLLGYLTPIHVVFVICYTVLIFDFVMFGVLSKKVREKFQIVVRKCFRDMKDISRARALGWSIKVLLIPFQKHGVYALVFIWIYWIVMIPFVSTVLSFYFLPTVNITVRLFLHFIAYCVPYGKHCLHGRHRLIDFYNSLLKTFGIDFLTKKEKLQRPFSITMHYRILQLVIIFICITSVLSFVLLLMECVVFFVEIVVYTMIGIIINASHIMKYVTLITMLVLYARDCFGSVTKRYLVFNDCIISVLQKKAEKDVKDISWKNAKTPQNSGIQVNPEHETPQDKSYLIIRNGVLKWDMPRVVLFLDGDDKLKITKRFFFETAYMPHVGCPGHLFQNLFNALFQLMVIVIFLLFVLLVVVTFGESYEISSTNQMLATLVGGFLPWIFRKVLFQPPPDLTIDTDSLHFQNLLDGVILQYRQNWPVGDLIVDQYTVCRDNDSTERENVNTESEVLDEGDVEIKSEKDVFYDCESVFEYDEERGLIDVPVGVNTPSDGVDIIINTFKEKTTDNSVTNIV